jgi:hypothetical protein
MITWFVKKIYHYSTALTSWSWTWLYGKRETSEPDYAKMTKGDLRKLKTQGKIKSIYFPYK